MKQGGTPSLENQSNLIRVFLGGEIIKRSLSLKQRGVDGPLRLVVGLQMKWMFCCAGTLRRQRWTSQDPATEVNGQDGCGDPLTTSSEEVAAAKIDPAIRHLPLTQSNAPRKLISD
jgi:hypothetical protein